MKMVWAVVYGNEYEACINDPDDLFLINESICSMCDTKELAEEILAEESQTEYGKEFSWEIYGYPLNSKEVEV